MNGISLCSHLVLKTALGKKMEKEGGLLLIPLTLLKGLTTSSTNTTNNPQGGYILSGGLYCVYGYMK